MENLLKLNLKKRLTMRGYQETIVNDIVTNFNIGKPYVLGSCPSSGKTEMAIEAMIRLIEAGHVNRVLILAHSTNVLKENFYNRLTEYFNESDIEVMRGQKDYNYDAKIQVMIPQNIKHITGEFELVITDEAQHNVLAEDGNYDRIIDMIQPKFQLLLTGTPSKFVRENALSEGDAPYYINTVGMDTIGFEHFHDVRFDLIRSAYGFTNADYNQTQDLLTDVKFSFDETETTINNVIVGAVRNIALRNGVNLPKDSDFILEGKKLVKSGKFGKTLIMCRSIEQANQTAQIISKLFGVNVRVSQSQNDSDSRELDNFKEGKFNFLCVVKRAREGYDDNKVLNLIDITMTHNIDLIYQMFCRVVRLDKTNPNPKLYVKVTSNAEGMPEYTMNIMTAALMLGSTENLARFNGSNFRDIEMPRVQQEEPDEEEDIVVNGVVDIVDTEGNIIRRRNINELMALDLIQMFTEDHENLVNGNDRYAMTTLGDALLKLQPSIFDVSTIDECVELGVNHDVKSGIDWTKKYKEVGVLENLKLPSEPWNTFNLEGGITEFSKLLGNNKYIYDVSSIEECVELGIKYGIKSAMNWNLKYKEINKKVKTPIHPWKTFKLKGGMKEFSRLLGNNYYTYDISSIEECVELGIKYGIKSGVDWSKKHKEIEGKENLKLPTQPWNIFKLEGGITEFSRLLGSDKYLYDVSTIDECVNLAIKHGIMSAVMWSKKYKEVGVLENLKLPSKPWNTFNLEGGMIEFSCLLGNTLGVFDVSSIDECVELGIKYNIKSSAMWSNKYKEIEEKENVKLPSTPWILFNLEGGNSQFSILLGGGRKIFDVSSIDECVELGVKYKVTSGKQWIEKSDIIGEKENKKLPNQPWKVFRLDGGCASFTKLLGGKFDVSSIEECVDLGIKYGVKSGNKWSKERWFKIIGEKEKLRLPPQPWNVFKLEGGEKEFSYLLKINKKLEPLPAYLGEFSEMNKKWNTSNSNTNYKRYKKDNSEWKTYHKLYSKAREKWSEIPYVEISKKLKERPEWVVGDFGCGENLLSKEIKNKVLAFDHVAIDGSVISCDLSCIPLDNEVLDVAVFSLALMYTNYIEYLKEANRLLKPMGLLMIAEPRNRWSDDDGNLDNDRIKLLLDSTGFKMTGDVKVTESFIYIDAIKY